MAELDDEESGGNPSAENKRDANLGEAPSGGSATAAALRVAFDGEPRPFHWKNRRTRTKLNSLSGKSGKKQQCLV